VISQKLTIITTLVNTHNPHRIVQVERFVQYHVQFGCNIIVICPDDLAEIGTNFLDAQVVYCNSSFTIIQKLLLALKYVRTPYISWIADDDFLGYDFALKSVNLLDSKEYVAGCDGFMFFLEEESLKRKDILYSYKSYKNGIKEKTNGHKGKRFRFQADFYHPGIFHTINRTYVFKNAIEFIENHDVAVNLADRVFVAITMMHGDIQFLKNIANIRSFGTRIMHHNPSLFNKPEIRPRDLIMNDTLMQAIMNYYQNLHGNLAPGIKSEILYFLMKSSKALNDYSDKTTLKYKLSNFYHLLQAYLEPIKLATFNKRVREDIKLAKKYMKEYSLKGDV
jgi:hypothetical protein